MKAWLIDPHLMTVTECEYNNFFGGPGGPYELLGCRLIEVVYMHNYPDNIFIDEEGRFKTQPGFFTSLWPFGPLAGKAMVTGGPDENGDGTPTTLTREQVANSITWVSSVPEL